MSAQDLRCELRASSRLGFVSFLVASGMLGTALAEAGVGWGWWMPGLGGWLGWLAGWLAGWVAGWLAGRTSLPLR